eukprot:2989651-Rhodomonas_salina.1
MDDGGLDRGGIDTSTRNITVRVLPVNNDPVFDLASTNVQVSEVLSQTTFLWTSQAKNISAGSPTGNEDDQTLSFTVAFVSGNANLFASGLAPSLSSTGDLNFTLVPYENGDATFNI